MIEILKDKKIVFIGGGMACRSILQIILSKTFSDQGIIILGVADINDQAVGLKYARENGIFVTDDYRDFFQYKNLDLIIELTGNKGVLDAIVENKPADVELMDHIDAMYLWDFVQIEEKKLAVEQELQKGITENRAVCNLFEQFSDDLTNIMQERTRSLLEIKKRQERRNRELSSLCCNTVLARHRIATVLSHRGKCFRSLV